jgi:hypothetical protein
MKLNRPALTPWPALKDWWNNRGRRLGWCDYKIRQESPTLDGEIRAELSRGWQTEFVEHIVKTGEID